MSIFNTPTESEIFVLLIVNDRRLLQYLPLKLFKYDKLFNSVELRAFISRQVSFFLPLAEKIYTYYAGECTSVS